MLIENLMIFIYHAYAMLHSKLRQAPRKKRQVAANYFPKG